MTTDIKKSWFLVNWDKPKRIKRHIKRFSRKSRNVSSIKLMADRYHLDMPDVYKNIVKDKASHYEKQYYRLWYIMNAYLNGEMTKDNYVEVIDNVYKGKSYWLKTRPKDYPKYQPLVPDAPKKVEVQKETLLGKIIHKIVG